MAESKKHRYEHKGFNKFHGVPFLFVKITIFNLERNGGAVRFHFGGISRWHLGCLFENPTKVPYLR